MSPARLSRLCCWSLLLAALLPFCARANPAPRRPNILFLLTDDQRADTIHALGNSAIRTPNLDRLARQGLAFTEAHIMGGMQGAVCVPSRAMLLSGRTLFRVPENLAGVETWPMKLGEGGYRTFITGKWHNGADSVGRSFAEGEAVFLGGMTDQNLVRVRDLANGRLGEERTVAQASSEIFADAAVQFLRGLRDERPFCLYVAFTSPHDPRTAPAAYRSAYEPSRLILPPNFLPGHPFDNGEMSVRDEMLLPQPRSPEAVRAALADYYAMISHVDAQIGRILAALRESGRESNTVIVFAGDNGLALGSHGLLGKQNLYEHSTRVPLILSGPGIVANRRVKKFVYLFDLAPSLCELAGVSAPTGTEGLSLARCLSGGEVPQREFLFSAYRTVQRAVRDRRWKLIRYPQASRTQLFDLKRDPAERIDLAGQARYARTRARLESQLTRMQGELGDPLVRDNP